MTIDNRDRRLKVHLGAFDRSVATWMNTDITLHLYIARIPFLPSLLHFIGLLPHDRYRQHRNNVFHGLRYLDLTKPLPFSDGSVNAFFSSHVFEHLFFDEVELLIRELYRCLEPGGICRVVVPDLEKVILLYDRQDPRRFVQDLLESRTRASMKCSHHSAFTGPLLRKMFLDSGFRESEILDYRVGRCPDIDILDNRPEESIFFEAVK
jgi:SAM-dependent methyltransferase